MLLLRSLGKFLSPYSKTCTRASLEFLTYPYGRNRAKTPGRNLSGRKQKLSNVSQTLEFHLKQNFAKHYAHDQG